MERGIFVVILLRKQLASGVQSRCQLCMASASERTALRRQVLSVKTFSSRGFVTHKTLRAPLVTVSAVREKGVFVQFRFKGLEIQKQVQYLLIHAWERSWVWTKMRSEAFETVVGVVSRCKESFFHLPNSIEFHIQWESGSVDSFTTARISIYPMRFYD